MTGGAAPSLTLAPGTQTVLASRDVTFSVAATGVPPPRYQWRVNRQPLPGATGSTLQLANVQPDQAGIYDVVVFNELACRQRRLLLGSRLLGVAGQLQREGEGEHAVVHLIAMRLFDHSELLGSLVTASRNFC